MSSPIMQAIKQVSDEKNIPVESVLETIEAALAAAYRKDFGSREQNIKVNFDPNEFDMDSLGGIEVFDVKTVVEDMELEERDEGAPLDAPVAAKPLVEASLGSLATGTAKLVQVEEGEVVEGEEPAEEEAEEVEDEVEDTEAAAEDSEEADAETEETAEAEAGAEAPAAEAAEASEATPGEAEEEEEVRRFNPKTEVMVSYARETLKEDAQIGEEIWTPLEVPDAFGRMAAQTAKQVIIQKIRDAEYEKVFGEFKDKERTLVTATVQRVEGRNVLFDLGGAAGIMPPEEQVKTERYSSGDRLKVFITEVRATNRGPAIIVSRTHPEIVRQLFLMEIPEIASGIVEMKGVSREAGSRSKVAVLTTQDNVDPIGACIGQRGTRIQTIISELGGEKVDIILFDEDPVTYIANALSPAKVVEIALDEDEREAEVIVNESQLSLAIGRGGQNVRLASKLTGWRINIKDLSEVTGGAVVAEAATETVAVAADDEVEDETADQPVVELETADDETEALATEPTEEAEATEEAEPTEEADVEDPAAEPEAEESETDEPEADEADEAEEETSDKEA
jgi:N utilization substance protein A